MKRKALPDRLDLRFWIRGILLLAVLIGLTWYAKFHKSSPKAVRSHATIVWMMPTLQGISVLFVLPDDNLRNGPIRNGLRVWWNPPQSPILAEQANHILYRGSQLLLIADTLTPVQIREATSMVDTGGTLYTATRNTIPPSSFVESPIKVLARSVTELPPHWLNEVLPEGFQMQYEPEQSIHLAWGGYRIQLWVTDRMANTELDQKDYSLGIITTCENSTSSIHNKRIATLVYCGDAMGDSSRLNLQDSGAGAVLLDLEKDSRLNIKRIHFPRDLRITGSL